MWKVTEPSPPQANLYAEKPNTLYYARMSQLRWIRIIIIQWQVNLKLKNIDASTLTLTVICSFVNQNLSELFFWIGMSGSVL